MKKLFAVVLLLAGMAAAQSIPIISGNLTAATTDCSIGAGCVVLPLNDNSAASLKLSGTFVGTIQFEASNDNGATYNAIPCQPLATGAYATSSTGTGVWLCSVAGMTHIRARVSAYTSGTAVVNMSSGKASFGAQGGGTGTQQVAGTVAAGSAIPNPVIAGGANAAGQSQALLADLKGALYHGPTAGFSCVVATSTATTLQAVGSPCAAPGAGLSLYITEIKFNASAAGIAADAFPTLKYGTGGTCGTGTAIFWGHLSAAAVTAMDSFTTPIKIPANNEICWISSTAGSKFLVITGFIAP